MRYQQCTVWIKRYVYVNYKVFFPFTRQQTEFKFKNIQHLNKISLICYVYTNMCILSNNLWLNHIHVLMHRSRIFPFGFWGIILFARNIRGLFLVALQVWTFQKGWAQTSPFPLNFLHFYMYLQINLARKTTVTEGMNSPLVCIDECVETNGG